MKRKEDEPKKGAPAYMNTYGDMMTLLLTFFVLLFAMSTVDADKFQQLVASTNSSSISIFDGGQTVNTDTNILQNGMSQFPISEDVLALQEEAVKQQELADTAAELQQYIEEHGVDDKVTVGKQGNNIVMRFDDVLLFDQGKAELKAGAIPTLNAIGNQLKGYLANGYVMNIEGHTDNVPIHTGQFPSNWELSSARAIAVMRFYLEEMDFDQSKISCVGKAEYQPIASNDTAEGQAMNRRVEIIINKSAS